jgi:hypothetical protein
VPFNSALLAEASPMPDTNAGHPNARWGSGHIQPKTSVKDLDLPLIRPWPAGLVPVCRRSSPLDYKTKARWSESDEIHWLRS